ncbi:hypothetical protein D3C87_279930 [compost metagenome]
MSEAKQIPELVVKQKLAKVLDIISDTKSNLAEREAAYWKSDWLVYDSLYAKASKLHGELYTVKVSDNDLAVPYTHMALGSDTIVLIRTKVSYRPRNAAPTFKDFKNRIIKHFKLDSKEFPHYRDTPYQIEFMYAGTKVLILDYANTLADKESESLELKPASNEWMHYVESLSGVSDILNHLHNKHGIKFNKGSIQLVEKDIDGNECPFYVTGEFNSMHYVLGIPVRAKFSTIQNGFRTYYDLFAWFMQSPFVSLEDFGIAGNKYIGPDDYYGIPLLKKVVDAYLTRYPSLRGPDGLVNVDKLYGTRVSRDQALVKIGTGVASIDSGTHSKWMEFKSERDTQRTYAHKYNKTILKEFLKLDEDQVTGFDEEFRAKIQKRTSFDFFLMSSSKETIMNKILETFPIRATTLGLKPLVLFG